MYQMSMGTVIPNLKIPSVEHKNYRTDENGTF
jgi:hypothetical protein